MTLTMNLNSRVHVMSAGCVIEIPILSSDEWTLFYAFMLSMESFILCAVDVSALLDVC